MLRSKSVAARATPLRVALVGNPNAGKTTLFNALTGHRQRVGNFPGTTVEKRTGHVRGDGASRSFAVMDLPGAYSLGSRSADEAVVMESLLSLHHDSPPPDVIVSVVDATNMARHLFLTSQLLELDRPLVVALNMSDRVESCGLQIDHATLAARLGVPVIPVSATKGHGIEQLSRAIADTRSRPAPHSTPRFPESLTHELDDLLQHHTPGHESERRAAVRVELMQALLNPGGAHEHELVNRFGSELTTDLESARRRITASGESLVEVEASTRYAWIEEVLRSSVRVAARPRSKSSARIDGVLTHPVAGLVVLLVLLACCFQAIYAWAGPLMEAIDSGFGWVGSRAAAMLPEGALRSLIVDGAIAGVGAVLVFLPQIVILFLFVALIEDCGYLARAAFLLDRWMRLFGLNGKAFIPLLSSFACAVPAIMATRVIEDRRDRLLTILIAPLLSCSARLPVYTLMIAAFIPATALLGGLLNLQAVTLLAMYMIGIVAAVPVAWVLKKTMLPGKPQPFLMELPPYRWPSPMTVFFRVFQQAKAFCVSAGTMIFAVSIVIWALGYYPHPSSIATEHERLRESVRTEAAAAGQPDPEERLSEINRQEAGAYLRQSVLGRLGTVLEPAVKPLGWDWRIGTAAIASFPAREVVIATLGTLYNLGAEEDESSEGLRHMLAAATWPDGRPVYNTAVALSIMVFFALCCQCNATLATIRRETNSWRWPLFAFGYMTALAYVAALITYQIAIRLT